MPDAVKTTPQIEKRYFDVTEFRIEDTDKGKKLIGYAAVFNLFSLELDDWLYGTYKERIANGAFAETIVNDDIRALFNHEPNLILGRNKAGTLRLKEDSQGLLIENDIPDTQLGRDMIVSVGRKDLTGMSFAFQTQKEQMDEEQDPPVRTLLKVKLFDVSIVTYPAYPDTSVGVRSIDQWLKDKDQAKRSLNSMRNRLRLTEHI